MPATLTFDEVHRDKTFINGFLLTQFSALLPFRVLKVCELTLNKWLKPNEDTDSHGGKHEKGIPQYWRGIHSSRTISIPCGPNELFQVYHI